MIRDRSKSKRPRSRRSLPREISITGRPFSRLVLSMGNDGSSMNLERPPACVPVASSLRRRFQYWNVLRQRPFFSQYRVWVRPAVSNFSICFCHLTRVDTRLLSMSGAYNRSTVGARWGSSDAYDTWGGAALVSQENKFRRVRNFHLINDFLNEFSASKEKMIDERKSA